ncbi:hypothetical protein BJX96DRAFT_118336 [Aspergillus floccosus]
MTMREPRFRFGVKCCMVLDMALRVHLFPLFPYIRWADEMITTEMEMQRDLGDYATIVMIDHGTMFNQGPLSMHAWSILEGPGTGERLHSHGVYEIVLFLLCLFLLGHVLLIIPLGNQSDSLDFYWILSLSGWSF